MGWEQERARKVGGEERLKGRVDEITGKALILMRI